MDKRTRQSIDNSILSLFSMIVVAEDADGTCSIIDQNSELSNITAEDVGQEKTFTFAGLCRNFEKNIHPEDRDAFRKFTEHDEYVTALREHVHVSMECRIRQANRRYHWFEIIICNTTEEDSTKGDDCLMLVRDVHERKKIEIKKEAEERAVLKSLQKQYDALFEENMTDQQTGCYNRKGLKYYSDIVLDDARSNDNDLFVCVADLNGLKHLNDTYGHSAGDEAIAAVSGILRRSAPKGSKTVRIGGDEFMIFASVKKSSKEPDEFGDRVDKALAKYNEDHPNPYSVGASYGWVLLPPKDNMTSLDEYIEMADARMYEMRVKRDKYRRD